MKIDFDQEDIQSIAEKIIDLLKPHLPTAAYEDTKFDLKGLCAYLHVSAHWVYERTHLKEIPYIPLSKKHLLFSKRDIDIWLESHKVPEINNFQGKIKIVK